MPLSVLFLRPCARRAISLEHPFSQRMPSLPLRRWRYSSRFSGVGVEDGIEGVEESCGWIGSTLDFGGDKLLELWWQLDGGECHRVVGLEQRERRNGRGSGCDFFGKVLVVSA